MMRALVVIALNLVPLWGFTQDEWSPGTTLALYWFQSLVSIPVIAMLIVLHRRATHKLGHYSGVTITRTGGGEVRKRTTFLDGFLWMSIPFVVAHGIFLAVLLGIFFGRGPGAVDLEDLRIGIVATLNIVALGFAFDTFQIAQRPFAWIAFRAQNLMRRSMVVQLAILLGMGVSVFTDNGPAAFFNIFLVLKLLADLSGELPQWEPKEPPRWLARIMNRIGGPGSDFGADMKKEREQELAEDEANERSVDPAKLDWG
jgi:hypothetical protein